MPSHSANFDFTDAQTRGLIQSGNTGRTFNAENHHNENKGGAHQNNHIHIPLTLRQHKAVAIVGIVALVVCLSLGLIFGVVYGLKQQDNRQDGHAVSTTCTYC